MVTISTFGKLQRNIREDIFNFLSTSESNSQFRGLQKRKESGSNSMTTSTLLQNYRAKENIPMRSNSQIKRGNQCHWEKMSNLKTRVPRLRPCSACSPMGGCQRQGQHNPLLTEERDDNKGNETQRWHISRYTLR